MGIPAPRYRPELPGELTRPGRSLVLFPLPKRAPYPATRVSAMFRPHRLLALAICLFLALPIFATSARPAQESVSELVESLTRNRDESDPELVTKLANFQNKEAVEGLVKVYDAMGSNYMRREVLRALETFDGVAAGQQVALQKMMDVATNADDREMRAMALQSISRCRSLGKSFLENVVESPAEDEVREQALRYHIDMADSSDNEWYRKLYDPDLVEKAEEEQKNPRKKNKKKKGEEEDEGTLMVHSLPELRALAFEKLSNEMKVAELIEATDDKQWRVRKLALEKLQTVDAKKVLSIAEDVLGDLQRRGTERVAAARILLEEQGSKIAGELLDIADKSVDVTPNELRFAIADMLAGIEDEKLQKKFVKLIGKGKGPDKLFALRLNAKNPDPKLNDKLVKGLRDKDRDVKLATIRILGERKATEALEDLQKAMDKDEKKDKESLAVYLRAIGNIQENDEAFEAKLLEYAKSDARDLRNASIELLAETGGKKHMKLFEEALSNDQWDTRYAALQALENLRDKEAIGLLVARMEHEDGRMLHEFSRALFRLTGQPFGKAHGGWKAWWEREGKDLDPISQSELKKRIKEEEERELKQRSKASFFGIKIVSKRVTFVIDVSGSMNEPMRTRYVDESTGETRMTVAQRELKKSIDSLDRGALFNIITFSSDVSPWLDDGIVGSNELTRDEAKDYVDKLGAGGGTNVYGAMREAFKDEQVDAIYFLSDGEPTVGDVIDPQTIRDHVAQWNENRDIEIHCVAIGGSLQVLEWLAEDSGGTYIKFN